MRQRADWDGPDRFHFGPGREHLDGILAADGHIGQRAATVAAKGEMIGDWAGIDGAGNLELGDVDADRSCTRRTSTR